MAVVFPFVQKVANLQQPECTAPSWNNNKKVWEAANKQYDITAKQYIKIC